MNKKDQRGDLAWLILVILLSVSLLALSSSNLSLITTASIVETSFPHLFWQILFVIIIVVAFILLYKKQKK